MTAKRILFLVSILLGLALPVYAQAALTVTPITWNVVGLDSNDPTVGPNVFPVGVRVCNTGSSTVNGVTADFAWDTSNSYINLRTGSLSSIDLGSLAPNTCEDAYYEVEVTKDAAAFDTTREYHVTAAGTDSSTGLPVTGTSPQPRQLYVEYLISQGRNGFTALKVDGVSVAAGGSLNFMVGNTYTIEVDGFTATQGYNQLETFLNLPNTVYQILSVSTTYGSNTSPYVSNPANELYANACLWENDPGSPNYDSCVGGDYKTGGTVTTTYTIKIIGGAGTSDTLTGLFYDFSGSSYHYDNDFSSFQWTVNIVSAGLTKAFFPKVIKPGDTSTVTFTISNPGPQAITDVNFTDTLPSGVTFTNSPVNYDAGCGGSPSPAATTDPSTVTFSGITVAGYGTCTITATVTAANTGTYTNTTGDLFINSTTDTGSQGSDTLVVTQAQPPSSCSSPVTLATWTMPTSGQGSDGPPPSYTTIASDVSTATATYSLTSAGSQSIVTGGVTTNAWNITDAWPNVTGASGAVAPYFEFSVDSSNYGNITISTQYDMEAPGDWASNANDHIYVYASTDDNSYALAGSTVATKGSWQPAVSASAGTWGPTTYFRIVADTRGNKATSSLLLDNITITGCPWPRSVPTLSKAFSDTVIQQGSTSTLTFTFANPNTNAALTGVVFSDTLPTGLAVDNPGGFSNLTCTTGSITGQTITAAAGSTSISMSGATLSAGASCSFSVSVLGNVAGQYHNVSGNISSSETGPNTTSTGYGTDDLAVVAPPVISKTFGAGTILTGATTSLSFTIANPNTFTDLSSVAFSDVLSSDLTIVDSTTSNVCGAGSTLTVSSGTISLSGGSLAAGGSCTFSVTVNGATAGTVTNTTDNVSAYDANYGITVTGNTATADILVKDASPAISLLKQVATCDSSGNITGDWLHNLVTTGGYVCYKFTIENTGDVALDPVSISDDTLDVSTCNSNWTDPLPVASQTADPTETCTTGPVSVVTAGVTNTATAHGTYNGTSHDSNDSTATYEVTGLQIAKTFTDSAYSADYGPSYTFAGYGYVLYYNYTVTNTGSADLTFPITVTDDKTTVTCPSTYTDGGIILPGNGGSITCTASYTTTSSDVLSGSVTNTAYAQTSDSPQVTSNTVSATATYSPTLVLLSGFGAYQEDGVVVVWWKTASEINTLGFNLLRLDPVTGKYNAVNSGLLPGILNPYHGGDYSLRDPGAVPGDTYTYKLVEVEVSGNERTYGPFTVFTGYAPAADDQVMPAGTNYERTERVIPGSDKALMAARHSRAAAVKTQAALVGDRIKISVTEDGLNYVDANDIASMLGMNTTEVSGMIARNMISVSNRGRQVAYLPAQNGAGLYFYGTHIDSIYTNDNVYWIDKAEGTPMTTLGGNGPAIQAGTGSFSDTAHFEQNKLVWANLFNDPNADYWFWRSVFASSSYTNSFSQSFQLADPATTTGTVQVNLFGESDTYHDVMVSVNNGTQVEGTWSGLHSETVTGTFPLTEGENTITVEGHYAPGSYSTVLVQSFDVTYQRLYNAEENSLFFNNGDSAATVTVGGFSSPDIMVFDLTNPLMPKLVTATTIGSSGSGTTSYSVSLNGSADTPYLAVAGDGIKSASKVAVISSSLSSKKNAADYVIIAPPALVSTAQGLADYRSGQGMKTMVVNLDDIMNEFNYGISSPDAIRAFLSTAYSNWKIPPRYVVLAGDGSIDYKDYLGFGRNLIPAPMVPTDYGLAISDNYLVDFNGDHVPEMAIGRLPVLDASDLQTVIDKIETHEQNLGVKDAVLAADTPDSGGDFITDSINLAAFLPSDYSIQTLYLSDPSLAGDMNNELIKYINDGTAFFNYVGHGDPYQLSNHNLMTMGDVDRLTNKDILPTMTAMTCSAGDFSDPYGDVLGGALLLKSGGGVAAVWAASGLSDDTQSGILDREFYNAVSSDDKTVLGDAVLQAFSVYSREGTSPYMMDIYNILGDPAMRLR